MLKPYPALKTSSIFCHPVFLLLRSLSPVFCNLSIVDVLLMMHEI